MLSCIFFLLALLTYINAVSHIHGAFHKSLHQTKWHYFSVCLIFSACSLLSKEQGVTVLGVCAGYDVFLHWDTLWSTLVGGCLNRRKRKVSSEGDDYPTQAAEGESEGKETIPVENASTGDNGRIVNKTSQDSHTTAGNGKHKSKGERKSPIDSNNAAATVVSRLLGRLG